MTQWLGYYVFDPGTFWLLFGVWTTLVMAGAYSTGWIYGKRDR